MTEPTDKHKAEAREIVHRWKQSTGIQVGIHYAASDETRLLDAFASTLASRDSEVREVLEGLIVSVIDGENCWCPDPFSADSEKHDAACLAARGLWERVQGEQQ